MRLFIPLLFAPFAAFAAPAGSRIPTLPPHPGQDFDLTRGQIQSQPSPVPTADTSRLVRVSIVQLKQNPALLLDALNAAIDAEDAAQVKLLLAVYEETGGQDKILIQFARAFLARVAGEGGLAVSHYSDIIAERPDLTPVRVHLAMTLLQDRRLADADKQFDIIRNSPDVPADIIEMAAERQQWIKRQNAWAFDTGIRYLHERNVNNAPKNRTWRNWRLPEPQRAHGYGYDFYAGKTQSLAGHFGWKANALLYGKTYWDNHRYDDLNIRLSAGVTWRSGRQEWAAMPFYEHRRYGNRPYSRQTGIRLQNDTFLSPNRQFFSALQYGRKQHNGRPYLDGDAVSASTTLLFRLSARQYWLVGTDYSRERAADADEAYRRIGIRTAWGYEWRHGLSASLNLSAARRRYDGYDYFQILRRDREYSATASLWHRDWQWRGLVPKLTAVWSRTQSNHFMGDYGHKSQAFFEIGKQF